MDQAEWKCRKPRDGHAVLKTLLPLRRQFPWFSDRSHPRHGRCSAQAMKSQPSRTSRHGVAARAKVGRTAGPGPSTCPTTNHWRRGSPGFTRLEALVVLVLIALLLPLGLSLSGLGINRGRRSENFRCVNNLKQLGLSFRLFHEEGPTDAPLLPELRSGSEYYAALLARSNVLATPRILVCPSDRATRAEAANWAEFGSVGIRNRGISYLAVPEARENEPGAILFADRSLETQPPLTVFSYRSPAAVLGGLGTNLEAIAKGAAWTPDAMHRSKGQAAMADGSVQYLDNARLVSALQGVARAGHRVVQPGLGPD